MEPRKYISSKATNQCAKNVFVNDNFIGNTEACEAKAERMVKKPLELFNWCNSTCASWAKSSRITWDHFRNGNFRALFWSCTSQTFQVMLRKAKVRKAVA